MRRKSELVVVLMLFGATAIAFHVHWPIWNFEMAYDTRAFGRMHAGLPRYAVTLGYDAGRLETVLARLGVGRGTRLAATIPGVDQRRSEPEAAAGPERSETAASTIAEVIKDAAAPEAKVQIDDPALTLDIAKVAPEGTSVFAGRAPAGAQVTLQDGDKTVGTATAGPDGDWSLSTEHRFTSAEPKIALRNQGVKSATAEPAAPSIPSNPHMAEASPADAHPQLETSPAEKLVGDLKDAVEAARQENSEREQMTAVSGPSAIEWPVVRDLTEPTAKTSAPKPEIAELKPAEPPKSSIIPIPMQFVYKQATLTDEGRDALTLLLEYLKLKKLDAVTLSGHADERGNAKANLKLSRARLVAIRQRLRDGGYDGKIELLPLGESEPFAGVDRTRLSREELMQLDRRVELRVSH